MFTIEPWRFSIIAGSTARAPESCALETDLSPLGDCHRARVGVGVAAGVVD
jgi:hypothetical protein